MADKKGSKKRCNNCYTLLIKATVVKGIAELQCDVCGHSTIVREAGESYNAIKDTLEQVKTNKFRLFAFG